MSAAVVTLKRHAPIKTWFGIGGKADALVQPATAEELRAVLLERDPSNGPVRVLGDGANLLVHDDGVDGLVIDLRGFKRLEWNDARVIAGAGVLLPRLVTESCRRGLGGLEGLGGIPATVGGAVRMNAGGAFGEIGDVVAAVRVVDHAGMSHRLTRAELEFSYRASNLGGLVIEEVELVLTPGDPVALRQRLKDVMAHKKHAQPLAEKSAGCVFKNPEVDGERLSAGRLIDKAGLKNERVGGASVSEVHGNFIVVDRGATATDVLGLIRFVQERVLAESGVELERELVVWERGATDE